MKLEVVNVKKSFDSKEILHGISFSAESGRALGLLGRNGAGKTTTIRIIMDVFHANSGEILLDGKKFEPDKNFIGYLPEERGLYPKKRIIDQMVFLARLRGISKSKATENAKKWLDRLGLTEYTYKKLETLSKGNQQKVQLAATLVADPDIVILDEPFSGLDPVNSRILRDVVRELISIGKIVIFSSHQMSYVEEFCDEIVIIDKGNIVLSGDLHEIKMEYGNNRRILSAAGMSLDELEKLINEKMSDKAKATAKKKNYIIIELLDGISQWDFLDSLKDLDIEIEQFGLYEPSLTDIFVARVGKNETEVPEDEE